MSDIPPPPPPGSNDGAPPPPPPPVPPASPPPPAAPQPPPAPPSPPAPPAPPSPPSPPYVGPAPAVNADVNSAGTIALVAGILSFFCLPVVGAILAIVFGIIGVGKAKQMHGIGRGQSLAGLILGIVNVVLSIIGAILFVVLVGVAADKASDSMDNWAGTADPGQYSYTIDSCEVDAMGDPSMTITVKNKTSTQKSWMFDYEFRASNGTLIDSGTTLPQSVPGNGSTRVDISGWSTSESSSVKCSIVEVSNWFN